MHIHDGHRSDRDRGRCTQGETRRLSPYVRILAGSYKGACGHACMRARAGVCEARAGVWAGRRGLHTCRGTVGGQTPRRQEGALPLRHAVSPSRGVWPSCVRHCHPRAVSQTQTSPGPPVALHPCFVPSSQSAPSPQVPTPAVPAAPVPLNLWCTPWLYCALAPVTSGQSDPC